MSDQTVFMFPGQGSQGVGMKGKMGELSDKQREVFTIADDVLDFSITDIIENGPEDELMKTSNTQPALLTMGIAYSIALAEAGLNPDIVMGHSLGEYSALVCAGVIDFKDGIKAVRKRGQLMEKAVEASPGKMAAVMKADRKALGEVVKDCSSSGVIEITNFNSPVQVVLSGETAAIERAVEKISNEGIGMAMMLNVSAPFHSSLMKPVADEFSDYLKSVVFQKPSLKFIDNVTGLFEDNPERIKEKLVMQLYRPVLWEQSVLTAHGDGAAVFIESGPGAVLTGLVKKTIKGITATPAKIALQKP